jgi:hypothetical protein
MSVLTLVPKKHDIPQDVQHVHNLLLIHVFKRSGRNGLKPIIHYMPQAQCNFPPNAEMKLCLLNLPDV